MCAHSHSVPGALFSYSLLRALGLGRAKCSKSSVLQPFSLASAPTTAMTMIMTDGEHFSRGAVSAKRRLQKAFPFLKAQIESEPFLLIFCQQKARTHKVFSYFHVRSFVVDAVP